MTECVATVGSDRLHHSTSADRTDEVLINSSNIVQTSKVDAVSNVEVGRLLCIRKYLTDERGASANSG